MRVRVTHGGVTNRKSVCPNIDGDLASSDKLYAYFHTRFSLMIFSKFENASFPIIFQNGKMPRFLLVPDRRGLRRQNTINIDPKIDQHRPT